MSTLAYYNDNDPQICAWLRELIKAGLITNGEVDERPIQEVSGEELSRFSRVHLFAGIGGWDYALQLAGWSGPVWSGSCPCQPFSCAGQRKGTSDKRHLWPEMRRLIEQCKPPVVFGEQVASKDGRLWLAGVRADLEALGYAFGASDLCAAGIGAPHIRQRLFWVAYSTESRQPWVGLRWKERTSKPSDSSRLAHNGSTGLEIGSVESAWSERPAIERSGEVGRVGEPESEQAGLSRQSRRQSNASYNGLGDTPGQGSLSSAHTGVCGSEESGGARNGEPKRSGFWGDYDLIPCADGKTRRIESGTFPLAHGVQGRVVRLRGYGNAINPEVAAEFIQASIEAISEIIC